MEAGHTAAVMVARESLRAGARDASRPADWRRRALLVLVVLLTAAGPAFAVEQAAGGAETPEAFVRRVYARYRASDVDPVPTERPAGEAFYAAALLDAFAKDAALLHGEEGVIDSDPLCACQAFDNLRVTRLTITQAAADTVKARVVIFNLRRHETVTLTLGQTPAGWRIADVANASMPSVMASLQNEIAHADQ